MDRVQICRTCERIRATASQHKKATQLSKTSPHLYIQPPPPHSPRKRPKDETTMAHTHTHTRNSDHWANRWDENDHVAFAATSVRVPPPQDSFPYVLLRNELLRDSRDNAQFERTVVTDSPLMRFLLPRKRNEKERQNQQNITKVENNATRTDKILRNEIRKRECDCAGSAFRMIIQNEKKKKKETAIRLGAPQLAYFFFIAHTHTHTKVFGGIVSPSRALRLFFSAHGSASSSP